MIITIAGIKRSASTAQFNLVRLALELSGHRVHVHGENYEPRKTLEVDLVKVHRFKRELAEASDHIFLSNRSPVEVKESLERFTGTLQSWERIVEFQKWLMFWGLYTKPEYYFEYRDWKKDRKQYARRIINLLDVGVGVNELLEEFDKITPPEKGQDKETLLFHNHITE